MSRERDEEEMDELPAAKMMELDDQQRWSCPRPYGHGDDDDDDDDDEGGEEGNSRATAAACLIRSNNNDEKRKSGKEMGGMKWDKLLSILKNNKGIGSNSSSFNSQIRVLLVEGDDSTRHIIAALLRKCYYKVAAVSDGLKAWEMLKERPHSIDVVLAEVDVPSISGITLLSMIMDHETCKNIPVIMMSSNDSINMVFNCMLKGAADFLVKPVRKNELRNLWQHVWRRHRCSSIGCDQDDHISDQQFETDHPHKVTNQSSGFAPPVKNNNKECSDKASDAESSCTRSNMEAESAYKRNSPDPQQTRRAFSHTKDTVSAGGEIQPTSSLLADHESNGEGKSIMLGSGCKPVNESSTINERLIEEECSRAQVETVNEDAKTIGSICDKNVAKDTEDQMYDEVMPQKHIIDFIGAIDNQQQFGYGIREYAAVHNNLHCTPEVLLHDEDFSCKSSSDPSLELSLRRYVHSGVDREEKTVHRTLNHSDSSAFSLYNRRTPVFYMARNMNLQSEGEEYCSPSTRQIPDNSLSNSSEVPRCNGMVQHVITEEAEFPNVGTCNQNGVAVKCSPIRVNPVAIPVGGMKFDQSASYHTLTQSISHPEPSSNLLWNGSPSKGREAICMSASHHSETNESYATSLQHPHNQPSESTFPYSAQLELQKGDADINDNEPRCDANVTGNNASSSICQGGSSSGQINSSGHGRILNEGNCGISATIMPRMTPEFQNQEKMKPAELHRISQREAALNKFRLKRKERCFEKKVRYQSRKRLAEQRPRVKGQFVRHAQPDAVDCQVG